MDPSCENIKWGKCQMSEKEKHRRKHETRDSQQVPQPPALTFDVIPGERKYFALAKQGKFLSLTSAKGLLQINVSLSLSVRCII